MRMFECKLIATAILSLFALLESFGQAKTKWEMKPIATPTRWAKEVKPEYPLPEYPRPQLERKKWQNLNGLWQYAITDRNAPCPSSFQGQVLVPYPIESALSGVQKPLLPSQILWYKRSFKKPIITLENRLLLQFGAVDYEATIYINNHKVGEHTGGYTSFTCDITDAVREGNNELVIKVYDPTDYGIGPCGKQVLDQGNTGSIYYTPSSGIWQTVWLEQVPSVYINKLVLTPNVDQKLINVTVITKGDNSNMQAEVMVTANGRTINNVIDKADALFALEVKNARLWSPDDPFLYDLRIRLLKNGKIVDEIKSYFGMRKIAVQKDSSGIDRIFLNNEYTYNLGTLDQGFWPDGLYTAPTDEALAFDIKAIKAMGFNTIRKHIKIEPARWYYHADKLGMLVWQDFVNPNQRLPEGAKRIFELQLKETIDQLHNYPCITTWVLFNEKWGAYDQQRITEWVKQYDPSRIVNGHSGELLYVNNQLRSPSTNAFVSADMTDVHSYPFPRNPPGEQGKAKVLGEFGGIGVPIEGHLWNDLIGGWGYDGVVSPAMMEKQFKQMVDSLIVLEKDGLSGSIYTQPFDVETELNGLMTYDRSIIKLSPITIRDIQLRLWSTTKNCAIATEGFTAKVALPIIKDYATRLLEYKTGKKDSAFLRSIAILSDAQKDNEILAKVVNDYLQVIKNPFLATNLNFIKRFTRTNKDAGFKFIIANAKKIEKTVNGNEVLRVAQNIIQSETHSKILDKDLTPDLKAIEIAIVNKYGNVGELPVLEDIAMYYYLHKCITEFVEIKVEIREKYPNATSTFDLNNDAWFVFQNTSNIQQLETALSWSKIAIERVRTANYYDTYANILYKLGRTNEAIQAQEKALTLTPGNGSMEDIKSNLEKMMSGKSTWEIDGEEQKQVEN